MKYSLNHLIQLLNQKLKLSLSISFGIFLFILFFQPFTINQFNFNDRLLFVTGFGAIIFIIIFIVEVVLPWINQSYFENNNKAYSPSYLRSFTFLTLSSTAFTFYLRYVGLVPVTFFTVFNIMLICLAPTVIIRVYNSFNVLKYQYELLLLEKASIQKQIDRINEEDLNKSIEFISENNTENLTLPISDIAFIKSADNYVEIVFTENNVFKKKLIRTTLKNIELQIKPFSIFIRCHRICIVNRNFIVKLSKSFGSNRINIKGYNEQIPVSRQYLLKLKEVL